MFASEEQLSAWKHSAGKQPCVDDEHELFLVESIEANSISIESANRKYEDVHNILSISIANLCIASILYGKPHSSICNYYTWY